METFTISQICNSGHKISLRSEQMRLCCVLMCHTFVLPYIANFMCLLVHSASPVLRTCLRGKRGEKWLSDSIISRITQNLTLFCLICLIMCLPFQEVTFSFSPHQIGTFEMKQIIDIIGTGVDKNNVDVLKTKPFHQIYLTLLGVCKSKRKSILFTINPGKILKT